MGEYPIPGQDRGGGGCPIQSWMGEEGTPHPDLGPDLDGGCTPSLVQDGGTPSQVRMGGYPIQSSMEGSTPSSPGPWGTPHPDLGPDLDGWYPRYYLPAVRTWDGVPPTPRPGMGSPPPDPDLGWDIPALSWTWDGGTPPPRSRCELTDKLKILPPPHSSDAGGNNLRVLHLDDQLKFTDILCLNVWNSALHISITLFCRIRVGF